MPIPITPDDGVQPKLATPPSLDAISETLMIDPAKPEDQPKPDTDAHLDPPQGEEDDAEDRDVDEPEVDDLDDDPPGEEPDPAGEEDPIDDDDDGYLDLLAGDTEEYEPDENDLPKVKGDPSYTLTIDGEARSIPLSEIFRLASLGGATMQRLKEATEAKKAAFDEGTAEARQQAQQILQAAQQQADYITQVAENFGEQLFAPTVEMPDPSMEQTDPIGFFSAVNKYRDDQTRIAQQKQQAAQVKLAADDVRLKRNAQLAASEMQQLRVEIPALQDPAKAEVFQTLIYEGGRSAGFNDQEIGQVLDRRLLRLAADAAAFHRLRASLAGAKKGGKQLTSRAVRKARNRSMAPGAGKRRVSRDVRRQKQQVQLTERARQSGTVDDVAATLFK